MPDAGHPLHLDIPHTRQRRILRLQHMHRISVETDGAVTVVAASGEIDAFVAGELTDAFTGAGDHVVADCEAISFLDSTALGVLVRAVREVDGRGGAIRVVLPKGTAKRIFEITTLDRVLPLSDTRADAIGELRAGT